MFDIFSEGPRGWKWAVPGLLAIVLIFWGVYVIDDGKQEMAGERLVVIGTFMVVLGLFMTLVFVSEYWRWVTDVQGNNFESRQSALSMTPTVLLAQSMRSMHPEAVRVLERFGVRTSWQVRVDANKGVRTWVLENTDPNVHFGFIEHVLSRSGKALLPKRSFSEGSRKWDPDGLVLDRDQYDELEKWLFARLMVTRSHGEFKPAEFIPPWNPKAIMEIMGLTGEQTLFEPEDALKELVDAPKGARAEASKAPKEAGVPDLRDEEWELIQRVEAEEGRKYMDGVVPR